MKNIALIICILESPNGRYYGFQLTRCADRAIVECQTSGGESNIRAALTHDGKNWRDDCYVYTARSTERQIFGLPNAGCKPEKIRAFVDSKLPPLPAPATDLASWFGGMMSCYPHSQRDAQMIQTAAREAGLFPLKASDRAALVVSVGEDRVAEFERICAR